MEDARLRRFLLRALALAAGAAGFYLTFRFLLPWCLPFLPALLIAARFEPLILRWQQRYRFRRGFSALVLTLTLLFLLGGLLSLLFSTLREQLGTVLSAAPALLDTLPDALETLFERLERGALLCPDWLRDLLRDQLALAADGADELLHTLLSRAVNALTHLAAALPGGALAVATGVLAVYFTAASYPTLRRALPEKARERIKLLRGGVSRSLARWLRAYALLSLITFCELLAGFLLMRQRCALLLALLITLLDALPVFGTGTALVPWAAVTLLVGFPPKGIVLLALYLCTLVTRNVLEPKLLSSHAGLPPIASLFAMYLGFCAFGIGGMVGFPFLLLLASQLLHAEEP